MIVDHDGLPLERVSDVLRSLHAALTPSEFAVVEHTVSTRGTEPIQWVIDQQTTYSLEAIIRWLRSRIRTWLATNANNLAGTPQRRPGPATFGVQDVSQINDIDTTSSDFPDKTIATLWGEPGNDVQLVDYVGNPTVRSGRDVLGPDSFTLHPDLNVTDGTELMWVLTPSGELLFGTRPHDLRRPHPTMVGGTDPEVISGGTITVRHRKILAIRDDSGHFQPGSSGIEPSLGAFNRLPREMFDPAFEGFVPFGGKALAGSPHQESVRLGRNLNDQLHARIQSDEVTKDKIADQIAKTPAKQKALLGGVRKALERQIALLREVAQYLRSVEPLLPEGDPRRATNSALCRQIDELEVPNEIASPEVISTNHDLCRNAHAALSDVTETGDLVDGHTLGV